MKKKAINALNVPGTYYVFVSNKFIAGRTSNADDISRTGVGFTYREQATDHINTVKKFNTRWVKIELVKDGELLKVWERTNIGT